MKILHHEGKNLCVTDISPQPKAIIIGGSRDKLGVVHHFGVVIFVYGIVGREASQSGVLALLSPL